MKMKEVRELSVADLREKRVDLRRNLWKARFDNFTNQLDDTSTLRKLRCDLARVETALGERAQAKAGS